MRRTAQSALQRAQNEGLSHEQLIQVDNYIENLKLGAEPNDANAQKNRKPKKKATDVKYQAKYEDSLTEVTKLKSEILQLKKQIESLQGQNESFKAELKIAFLTKMRISNLIKNLIFLTKITIVEHNFDF